MKRLLQHLFPLSLGVAGGFLVMNLLGVTLYAQGTKIHPDPGLVCAWDQPAASTAAANLIHVRATLDAGAAVDVTQTCTGAGSPFQCQFQASPAMQTTGPHTLKVEGANVDPIDGSLSSFVTLVTVSYEIVPPVSPPQPGSNGRIIKGVIGLVLTFLGLWSLFGHH